MNTLNTLSRSPLTYDDGNGIIITLIGNVTEQKSGELHVVFSISAPVIPTITRSFDLYDWRAVKQLGYFSPLRLVNSAYHAAMDAFIALLEESSSGQEQAADLGDSGSGQLQVADLDDSSSGQLQKADFEYSGSGQGRTADLDDSCSRQGRTAVVQGQVRQLGGGVRRAGIGRASPYVAPEQDRESCRRPFAALLVRAIWISCRGNTGTGQCPLRPPPVPVRRGATEDQCRTQTRARQCFKGGATSKINRRAIAPAPRPPLIINVALKPALDPYP